MLVLVEYFIEAVHGEEGDPGDVQLGDDLVGHSRLPAGGATTDPDDERLDLLALAIVPRGPPSCVDCPLGSSDDGLPLCAGDRDLHTAHYWSVSPSLAAMSDREMCLQF